MADAGLAIVVPRSKAVDEKDGAVKRADRDARIGETRERKEKAH